MKVLKRIFLRILPVLLASFLVVFFTGGFYSSLKGPAYAQMADAKCVSPAPAVGQSNLGAVNLAPNAQLGQADPNKPNRPADWFPSSYGNNNSDYQYLPYGHSGSKSLQVNIYDYKSGAANWLFNNQPVTPDQQYYFSDYYKSNIDSEVEADFAMPDGSTKYQILGFASPSKNWAKFQTSFTVPLGAQTFAVYQYIQAKGSLTTSDYTLTAYQPQGFNSPMLTLTFDDGYESTYQYGLPSMQKYNFKSTQFIITDLIGDKQYMTKPQVQALIAAGHEVASHTVTHNSLAAESEPVVKAEVKQSKNSLARLTSSNISDFAYPLGIHSPQIEQAVASEYSAARGVEVGLNSKDNFNCYDLKTEDIHSDTTPDQVADWVKQAQATKTWLILVYHSVEPNTATDIGKSLFNVTPTQLDSQLAAIKASGIDVETMAGAINKIDAQAVKPAKSVPVPRPAVKQSAIISLLAGK